MVGRRASPSQQRTTCNEEGLLAFGIIQLIPRTFGFLKLPAATVGKNEPKYCCIFRVLRHDALPDSVSGFNGSRGSLQHWRAFDDTLGKEDRVWRSLPGMTTSQAEIKRMKKSGWILKIYLKYTYISLGTHISVKNLYNMGWSESLAVRSACSLLFTGSLSVHWCSVCTCVCVRGQISGNQSYRQCELPYECWSWTWLSNLLLCCYCLLQRHFACIKWVRVSAFCCWYQMFTKLSVNSNICQALLKLRFWNVFHLKGSGV